MNNDEIIVRVTQEPTLKGVLKGEDQQNGSVGHRVIEDFGSLVDDMKQILDTDLAKKA